MDVVYVCREGENEELRYSLRSLKNFDHDNVWVVGGAPDWYTGKRLQVKQRKNKYENVKTNFEAIANSPDISDSFLLMNDDFFIVEPVTEIPYMYSRPFREFLDHYRSWAHNNLRVNIMSEVLDTLTILGISNPLDYELHVPMVFEKAKFREALRHGVAIRSLYGNIYQVGGVQTGDVKYHRFQYGGPEPYDIENRTSPFLSTSDGTFRIVHNRLLKKLFRDPSPYEQT